MRSSPTNQFFPKLTGATASFMEFGWTPNPDAWASLNALFRTWDKSGGGTFNAGRYSNPKLDTLIDGMRVESDLTRRRAMVGVALRIVRQRQQAEDVLHDAFMAIWTKAASFDATLGSGRGWVYSVTRNLALNSVRNGAREVTVDEETAEALDAQTSMAAHYQLADAFEAHASLGRLNDCLSRLEPARRNCILYAYVDGCSHGEIAARTQTPLGTVKAWIKRGMGSLRECMA